MQMEEKPAGQAKQTQNHPLSLRSGSATNALANTIFYGKQFKFNDKAIDPSPKWPPKIQISQNKKRIPALERPP